MAFRLFLQAILCLTIIRSAHAGCYNPVANVLECEFNCFKDLIDQDVNFEHVMIRLYGKDCGTVEHSFAAGQADKMVNLTIFTRSCPFESIELRQLPPRLEHFRIDRQDYTDRGRVVGSTMVHGESYETGLNTLKSLFVRDMCCDMMPRKMELPGLETLKIQCDNIFVAVSDQRRQDLEKTEEHHIVAPRLKQYDFSVITATPFQAKFPNRFLANLVKLTDLQVNYHSWLLDSLPNEIFVNLPALQKVDIKGLYRQDVIPVVDRCSNLGATNVNQIYLNGVSSVFIQSCVELFNSLNPQFLDIAAGSASTSSDLVLFDGYTKLNTTRLYLSSFPLKKVALQNLPKLQELNMNMKDLSTVDKGEIKGIQAKLMQLNQMHLKITECDSRTLEKVLEFSSGWNKRVTTECDYFLCRKEGSHTCRKPPKKNTYNRHDYETMNRVFVETCNAPCSEKDSADQMKSGHTLVASLVSLSMLAALKMF